MIFDAQYRLGRMYEQGWSGQDPDWVKSVEWYRKAVKAFEDYRLGSSEYLGDRPNTLRFIDSLYRLGHIHGQVGDDRGPNPEEAASWYGKAVKSDYRGDDARADPQFRLGRMYEHGWKGQRPEPETAKDYYDKAAAPRAGDQSRHGADEPDPQA